MGMQPVEDMDEHEQASEAAVCGGIRAWVEDAQHFAAWREEAAPLCLKCGLK